MKKYLKHILTVLFGATVLGGTYYNLQTLNPINLTKVTFNTASTTLCGIQNTSGQDRLIIKHTNNINAGTSDDNILRQFRTYVSNNYNGTTTADVIKEIALPTSTFRTGQVNTTTIAILWPINYWVMTTSTGISTSTGSCNPIYEAF